jgi:hypothetical protein
MPACGQEPAAEAPRPGGEHVEDVAPSHERVWAPRPEIFQDHMIAMVIAFRRPSMLAIATMSIHVNPTLRLSFYGHSIAKGSGVK